MRLSTNPTGNYRHLSLFLLAMVVLLASADRSVFGVVIEAVKNEFSMTDTQIGFLSGPAFAVFYALMGIPLARLSDVGNRRTVIAVCVSIWSLMTAFTGAAQSFVQMFIARVGVAVGEAGGLPPAHSLASTYYPSGQHGKVSSVLTLATTLGAVLGLAFGGYLLVEYNWRVSLYVLGLPGLLLALAVLLLLPEPRKLVSRPKLSSLLDSEARASIKMLIKKPTYAYLIASTSAFNFFFSGASAFLIPFYLRTYGVDEAEIGGKYGLVLGGASIVSLSLTMVLLDKLQKRNVAWLLRLPALAALASLPMFIAMVLAQSFHSSLLATFFAMFCVSMATPAVFASIYAVTATDQRAVGVAILGLVINILGVGLGPLCLGMLSDSLLDSYGDNSLRYSIALFSFITIPVSYLFWRGSKNIATDYVGERPDEESI